MEHQYLDISIAPADTAFGLMADFDADTHPSKVSLIAGAYRDENGNPWVLPSVKKAIQPQRKNVQAKERLGETTHEYLGIAGSPLFIKLAQDLIFGPVAPRLDNIASVQTVSGTGANHLAATFLARHLRPNHVFIPDPTWINHKAIWEMAGVAVSEYPYYSSVTKEVDMVRMLNALEQAEPNDVIILQACAHNPTGIDMSKSQWMQVADLVRRKNLFVVFDSAYQGFATGDIDGDAWAVRHFMDNLLKSETHPGLCVAQSFSKNFGLYGERVGALHLVVPKDFSARGALSELTAIARAEYSNPPRFGARIVEIILGDEELTAQWKVDLETMSSRIWSMRRDMKQRLEIETEEDWVHLEKQIGMFSYTGLRKEQVYRLRDEFHVYLLPSGRMSLCGLNDGNVQYVAYAIGQVMKT
ncbi:hypothetical protein N7520_002346 [Penicillium odoratum]|uniref:uncharacterized protein n=1 Tax=Penicillium odoratum TaxID=1167516 RepID=UPI0025478AA9|nr:uncharacterized protein N7520_002346 [Penicillium odoratum]KAJ5771817.1 hypothetical protein N7520_002346 [Penicillium odoratum]